MNIKLTDIKPESNFFGLFVGESGSGKTCAAASFPKPICFLDVDKRALGINGSSWISKDEIYIEQFKGDEILAELDTLFNLWEVEIARKTFKYKTVVFDGFTSLAMLLLDNSFDLTSKMSGFRKTQGHPKIGTVDIPGLDEYAYEQQGFKNVITALKYSLKCNVICTAHYVDTYDDMGKVNGKKINLRPRVLPLVSIFFDDIYYFEKKMRTKIIPKVGPMQIAEHMAYFRSDIARTSIAALPNSLDITEKSFYPELLRAVETNEAKLS